MSTARYSMTPPGFDQRAFDHGMRVYYCEGPSIDGIAHQCYTPEPRICLASGGHTGVDRNWLMQYPPGVPADIDPDEFASLREIFEEACAAHGHAPAFTNMGATLSYAQLDALS